jgi:RES domain-containing protein
MNRDIANAIAGTTLGSVRGVFYRHTHEGIKEIKGSTGGGRWGPEHGFPVIYLGQPIPSVIAEAHRRLVDPVMDGGMPAHLVGPRDLLTVEVDVDHLLDLRDPANVAAVGLDNNALYGPWPACVRVARAAHQLGLHGVVAPAATELGLTLALFEQHLPAEQFPRIIGRDNWPHLPPDPRTDAQRNAQIARRQLWPHL